MLKQVLKRLPGLRGLAAELHDLRIRLEQSHARELTGQAEMARLRDALKTAEERSRSLQLCGQSSDLDDAFLTEAAERAPEFCGHSVVWPWIKEHINRPGLEVLEIGSRLVVSRALWKDYLPDVNYTGFDFMDGPNVDVVGDAHKLADYLQGRQFDFVLSCAVFEHLTCPWLVAEEIAKVLRVGGRAYIETHFSFSEHETPWHFFQFNSRGLEQLFHPRLGFKVLDSGLSTPIIGRFARGSQGYLLDQPVNNLYCHAEIMVEKVAEPEPGFSWRDVAEDLLVSSSYPAPA
jgi:SAM-dependent methyltransferase